MNYNKITLQCFRIVKQTVVINSKCALHQKSSSGDYLDHQTESTKWPLCPRNTTQWRSRQMGSTLCLWAARYVRRLVACRCRRDPSVSFNVWNSHQ